ncbi:MAG: Polysaccharide deacetylase [Rhodoglobus sp.]|nr:Polysaccharide deacetylase [Rhodoglobus sp.]
MENALYNYSPITERAKLDLPDGARLAFYVGMNLEHFPIDGGGAAVSARTSGLVPDPLNYGWRDYGLRVGVWRMAELFAELGIRPTAILNSDVCLHYPQLIRAGLDAGWDWVAHGETNVRLQSGMNREEETRILRDMVGVLDKHLGTRPRGWLGPAMTETFNTPELLRDLGFSYVLDWCSDDRPFALNVPGMISVPYSVDLNDLGIFGQRTVEGSAYEEMVLDHFEVMLAEGGGVMALPLHPFVTGQPFRFKYLARILRKIAATEGVWMTTATEIADRYLATSGKGD